MPQTRLHFRSRVLRTLPRRVQWLIVIVLALVVGAALGVGTIRASFHSSPSQANSKPADSPGAFRPTPAQWAALKVAPIATMTFRTAQVTDGKITFNADKTTPVFSPYSGRVTKIIANLGDYVKKGQPLLALEATEFSQAQNDLISSLAALNSARSQLNLAQTSETRKHALYDAKAGSMQDWQQSQADLVSAKNNLRTAETVLASVRNRLRILGRNESEINSLQDAQKIDPTTFVFAPISGRVTDRQVGPGQYVQAGAANPLFSIGDLSTVWLVANVRETDAPSMRLGAPVEVRVLAFPERIFKARLTYVASSVDPTTHRLPVRAEIENPEGRLKPEMFATFSIITGGESLAPAVPESAVVYEGDTARVWVAKEGGVIESRQIRAGRIVNGMVEAIAGIELGEKIVTSGTLFIDRAAKPD
jgi:cobalt-zinc-cadmium efflux system membrane fusion protein